MIIYRTRKQTYTNNILGLMCRQLIDPKNFGVIKVNLILLKLLNIQHYIYIHLLKIALEIYFRTMQLYCYHLRRKIKRRGVKGKIN